MRFFGMVTTRHSHRYTPYALESFFRTTPLCEDDRFYLIDNDRIDDDDIARRFPRVRLIANESPRGFAGNVNRVMSLAAEQRADLFFLNNDLIFLEEWLPALLLDEPMILSPLCNQQVAYQVRNATFPPLMALEEYLGREADLAEIASHHRAHNDGIQLRPFIPFFCVKLPYAIYSRVGPLDEGFGAGGAEDNDYCLRAYLAGYGVAFAKKSFVLHFAGKSTWHGAEAPAVTMQRDWKYREAFEKKWGRRLLAFSIDRRIDDPDLTPALQQAFVEGRFKDVIEQLGERAPL
jgi:GT2 family glycosyltransferase